MKQLGLRLSCDFIGLEIQIFQQKHHVVISGLAQTCEWLKFAFGKIRKFNYYKHGFLIITS
jgi:hypothetical protein